jgi:RNA-directed DNA polymerase
MISRFVKVQGRKSPYGGDWVYRSTRLGRDPSKPRRVTRLLKRQRDCCAHCGLRFTTEDVIEVHHYDRNHHHNAFDNLRLIHGHCLELNLEKTRITHAKDGFEFVGFHLQWLTPSNRKPWLRAIPTPDNIKRLKAKVRQMTNGQQIADPYAKVIALNRVLRGWIVYYRHANVKDIANELDWWLYRRLTHWLKCHHNCGIRRVLAEYEQQQYGRRKNLAVCNEHGRAVFLYRMCDLPITQYRTRNYPNPYIQTGRSVTQVEGEPISPLKTDAWQGGSRHAEWQELRRQILDRDGYTCQHCGDNSNLEVHHLTARHKGGTDDPANLITWCENCHIQGDGYRAKFAQQGK